MDFTSFGGRRFFAVLLTGFGTSILCWFGKIDAQTYSVVIVPTVLGYLGVGTYSNIKEQKEVDGPK